MVVSPGMASPVTSGPGGGNIKVVVRVRPFNARERDRRATCVVHMKDTQTVLTPVSINTDSRSRALRSVPDAAKTFAFDKSYWSFDRSSDASFAGQDHLFADLGEPLLDNAFQGYNNCIFAYGQTGSGKSYSMMGTTSDPGIIPRICENLFRRILESDDPNLTSTVEVSYLEIYNEEVRDLLNPRTAKSSRLKVREHPILGPYVEDLAKLAVCSFPEIQTLMDEGNKARTVAATNMNETSSRSHAVFTLTLTQKRHDLDTNMDSEKVAKISLVDLAGSERASSSGAIGTRLKEGGEINKSLSTLGRVISTLADLSTGRKKQGSIVPYRDSTLTWLLKDSLGGNSLTAMIAAISPADINFDETLSTLRYADSAKRIKNHAVVNEDPNARMIRELKAELAQLRSKLGTGSNTGTVTTPNGLAESYPIDTPLDQQFVSITQPDGTVKKVSKADIAEQLNQSEKLYQDLHQTWEQKLQKTEQVQKEREAALEELGISIEKGFVGLSTPKRMPHLVNLSDDPLLAECLVYNLKPGTTTVGNADTASTADIRLNGTNVLHEHCSFDNNTSFVTITVKPNAAVMVNGRRVDTSKRLRTGCRVIIGDFHIFRFNHPQEARAEREEEGSRLRQSIAVDDIDSPSIRPAHERSLSNLSRPDSEFDGQRSRFDTSPIPFRGTHESDWSLARREAVSSALGSDQRMADMTDEELDALFDNLQRARAIRRIGGRRPLDGTPDDETDSVNSFVQREKYLSGTLDDLSIDTALTMPSTPQIESESNAIKAIRDEMQAQLDSEKQAYERRLEQAEASQLRIDQVEAERQAAEQSLQQMRDEMAQQLQIQREQHNRELQTISETAKERLKHPSGLTERESELAKNFIGRWRRCNYVKMAVCMLRNAATLKEAQIMSQAMGKTVVFQFVILGQGHEIGSTFDLVVNDMEDDELERLPKPCIGVRLVDFRNNVILLWSLPKLQSRLRSMRQMYQYHDRPEYTKHFQLDNPFIDSCVPTFTLVGDTDVPLAAVFDCQVKELTLDVVSPYTYTIIGILRLAIEPSSAEAPSSTLKFNVILNDLVGFSEREGTQVHAQMFISDSSGSSGMTTSSMVSHFGDKPIIFDSVHSLSLSLASPRESSLRISIFARATHTHLDKLLSWDDMRDSAKQVQRSRKRPRLNKHGPRQGRLSKHDVMARVRILELGEDGSYRPVSTAVLDSDTVGHASVFHLCQGLQRRVHIEVKGTSGASLPWTGVNNIRIGRLHLIDPAGKVTDMRSEQTDIALGVVKTPVIQTNRDYTTVMSVIARWDSGGSVLLDRPTMEGYRVQMTLVWEMTSVKLTRPLELGLDLAVQIRPRTVSGSLISLFVRPPVMPKSIAGVYALNVIPNIGRTGDLWRLDTRDSHVKGQEALSGWTPRGISLVKDYLIAHEKRQRAADVERNRQIVHRGQNARSADDTSIEGDSTFNERQIGLLERVIQSWTPGHRSAAMAILGDGENADPNAPTGQTLHVHSSEIRSTQLLATAHPVPLNPALSRSGNLLVQSGSTWEKRLVQLRPPYLHIFSTWPVEMVDILNLSAARIDREPGSSTRTGANGSARASTGTLSGNDAPPSLPKFVFAVHGVNRRMMFAAATEHDKAEWIFAIDTSYYGRAMNDSGSEEEME